MKRRMETGKSPTPGKKQAPAMPETKVKYKDPGFLSSKKAGSKKSESDVRPVGKRPAKPAGKYEHLRDKRI